MSADMQDRIKDSVIDDIVSVKKKNKILTWSIVLRAAGFVMLLLSFVMMVAWRYSFVQFFYQKVAWGLAGAGAAAFLTGRILVFIASRSKS